MLNFNFSILIKEIDQACNSFTSDRKKLQASGELFFEAGLYLWQSSEELLELAFPPEKSDVASQDTIIDESFGEFLAQFQPKSISTDFVYQYLESIPRHKPIVGDRQVRSLSPDEAPQELSEVIVEQQLQNITYDENIENWIVVVQSYLSLRPQKNKLHQIADATGLSLGQVLLVVLFGDFAIEKVVPGFYQDRKSTII